MDSNKMDHNKIYGDEYDAFLASTKCEDRSHKCSRWARQGMCRTSAATMSGVTALCRKSCGDCVPCPPGDILCLRQNLRHPFG